MCCLCADSNQQYGQHDNMLIFEKEEISNKDEHERLLEAAGDIEVTKSKQEVSVRHRLPFINPGPRLRFSKFVQQNTKFYDT